jgi:xeroderma pigmentosum group C-complementing protein
MTRARPPAPSSRGRTPQRSTSRRGQKPDSTVPQIYQDMLIEISSSSSGVEEGRKRPVKRRKVDERKVTWVDSGDDEPVEDVGNEDVYDTNHYGDDSDGADASEKRVQTVYVSDGSDESDMEWEEVNLQQSVPGQGQLGAPAAASDDEPLQLTLGDSSEKPKLSAPPRRKPVTAAERRWRLSLHKVHILCLLSHVYLRNLWCNDEDVQKCVSKRLSKHTVMCLNPREDKPQFSRSTTFIDGLNQASDAFRRNFKVTAPGMRRPYWMDSSERKDANVRLSVYLSPYFKDCAKDMY